MVSSPEYVHSDLFPVVLDFMKERKVCKKALCPLGLGYRGSRLVEGRVAGVSWWVEEQVGFSGKASVCYRGSRVHLPGPTMGSSFISCQVSIFCLWGYL